MEYKKRTMEDDIKDIGRCETDPDCLSVKRMKKEMKKEIREIKEHGPKGYFGIPGMRSY